MSRGWSFAPAGGQKSSQYFHTYVGKAKVLISSFRIINCYWKLVAASIELYSQFKTTSMKKLFLIISLASFAATSFGQKATISDLENLIKCKEFKCFNAYALACGFVFHDSTNLVGTEFTFLMKNKELPPKTYLVTTFISVDSIEGAILTEDKTYYLELEGQLEKMGFVKSPMDSELNSTWFPSKQYSTIKISFGSSGSVDEKDNWGGPYSVWARTW
jgi:hypothetical protein